MLLNFLKNWLNKPAWVEEGALVERQAAQDEVEFIRCLLENFQLPEDRRAEYAQGLCLLTPRQRQVLILMCHGNSQRLIAAQLEISPHTVRNHIRMICQLMGLSSRCEVQAAMLGLALSCLGRRGL